MGYSIYMLLRNLISRRELHSTKRCLYEATAAATGAVAASAAAAATRTGWVREAEALGSIDKCCPLPNRWGSTRHFREMFRMLERGRVRTFDPSSIDRPG